MGSLLSVLVNFSFLYNTIFLSGVSRSSPVNSPFGESSYVSGQLILSFEYMMAK